MSLVDQATGTYECDGCGKTIDVYKTHLWGDPTGWSEYCYACHTDMCQARVDLATKPINNYPQPCDHCEKLTNPDDLYVWGEPDNFSALCRDCHKDMCKVHLTNIEDVDKLVVKGKLHLPIDYTTGTDVYRCATCDKEISGFWDGVDYMGKKYCDDTCRMGQGLCPPSEYEQESKQNAKLEQEKEKTMFAPKTRGGYEYVIYKIYSEENSLSEFVIHGAVDDGHGWEAYTWTLAGRNTRTIQNALDLLPLKKRRFKTAEELVANQYGILEFKGNGNILVNHSGCGYVRLVSDTPEGNYTEEWLSVFTVEE